MSLFRSIRARVGLLMLAFASLAQAQDTALTRLLVANRHPIRLVNGRLEESGGRLLIDEGKSARFYLVGEEHGVAELPGVVEALLSELRPAGYNTFAIEVSPLQGQRLDSLT